MTRLAESPLAGGNEVWLCVCVTACPDSGARCKVVGEIDFDNAAQLRQTLLTALAAHRGGVSLDLSAVMFCDCSGLSVLLRARRYASDQHLSLRISAVSRPVRRLLELTGTASLLTEHAQPDSLRGYVE
ncbi:STAS domain-containing protein [Streptomyces sp. NPDC059385]|uniref:STAS domain-containing protein n=1 Tax=Streptomyces sp. NPDC059385 TaxID=3346817 RepID=UPI0036B93294